MRLCLYNPQAVHGILGTTLLTLPFELGKNTSHVKRFSFLLDLVRDKKCEVAIVVDGTASSLPFARLGSLFNNYPFIRAFSVLEVYLWCLANRINPFTQKIIFSLKKLNPQSDVLFGFAYFGRTFFDDAMTERSFFKKFTGKKALHATHYFGSTKKVADNVRKTGTTVMFSEANLKNSDYFNKHFGFIKKVHVLPFVLRKRYVSTADLSSRKNKCVALGTLEFFPPGHKHSEDHFEHFKVNTLHPMRKGIVDNLAGLGAVIDSLISTPQVEKRKSLFSFSTAAGKKYHSFNIVDKFNEYKMFVAPEENIGLPSINSIEGMACGSAYIGLDSPVYADFGLKKGVHYISYDGTIEDLIKKITYYQTHPDELERIADAGHRFVLENFQEPVIVQKFLGMIESI